MPVASDHPIRAIGDDELGRAPLADSFARQVLEFDASEGLVAGVLGPWGSGKTSFVNLARPHLDANAAAVVDFNPWMFSGAEQLVEAFFVELSAELKLKPGLEGIGNDLADYGEAFAGLGWLPVVGPWIERGRGAAKVLGKYLSRRREGTIGRRKKLMAALGKMPRPIVVVIDDIDRLSSQETRDIFKLVRLTASFPNVIYVVAFDRARVESALSGDGVSGRDYLAKILQVAVDLPVVSREVMIRQLTQALDSALEDRDVRELDSATWPNILFEVIWPLIDNMRDVRRFAASVPITIDNVGSQIALADLLAIEAIRVFLPDVWARIPVSVDALCTPSTPYSGSQGESVALKSAVDKLVETGGDDQEVVKAFIRRLFPFARRHIENNHYGPDFLNVYLRGRRIGHEAILSLYLERTAGKTISALDIAEGAWERMSDRQAFEGFMGSLAPDRKEDVIASLEAFEGEFLLEHAEVGVPVLVNLIPDLPERPRGMFDVDTRLVVGRVVYRLLRSLDDPETVAAVVASSFPDIQTLSGKFELLTTVGYREGAGHKLISLESADNFERQWRGEVRSASPHDLAREDDLARVLYWCGVDGQAAGETEIEVPSDPQVTLALLSSAKSEIRGQSGQDPTIVRTPVFAWELLTGIYGTEKLLIQRMEELKQSGLEIEEELLDLIDRYLGGWRPKDFEDKGEE